MVGDLEARVFPHGLDLGDDFTHEAFGFQFGSQDRVEGDGDTAFGQGVEAFLLDRFNEEVFLGEACIARGQGDGQETGGVELGLGGGTVFDVLERGADLAQLFAELRTEGAHLRLERVGDQSGVVFDELDGLDVQLVFDDLDIEVGERLVSLHEHLREGLAVLAVGTVTAGTTEGDDGEDFVHVRLELGVDPGFVHFGERAKVDRLRSVLVDAADEVAVDLFRHEGDHGSGGLRGGDEGGVQRHVGVDLVLRHLLAPVTGTAAADIPVGEVIHELLDVGGSFRDAIVVEVLVDALHHGVQLGQTPLVHDGQLVVVQRVLRGVELIDVRVEDEERVGVPEGTEDLSLRFRDGAAGEAVRQPGRGVRVEVPADGVGTVGVQRFHRVDGIALGLGHLLAVFVLDVAEDDDVLVWRLVEDEGADREKGVEPAAGLVDGLGNEVCRELGLEEFLVLEGIVVLGEGHGAGVEPAVDDFGDTLHLAAAVRALQLHAVHIGTVEFDVIRALDGFFLQFLDGTDAVSATAVRALPDVERGTPVTVTGQAPVLDVLEPVAEPAFADGLRDPVDGVVVSDEVVTDVGHLDEPGLSGVVDERRVAAPAERVVMLELRRVVEFAFLVEVHEDFRVGVLDEHAGVGSLGFQFTLLVDHLDEGKVIVAADASVVFTESGSDVDDAGTVIHGDVGVAGDEEALLALFVGEGLFEVVERLVLFVFEVLAHIGLEDFVSGFAVFGEFAENGVREGLGDVVGVTVRRLDLDVGVGRAHAESDVGGQGPGRRGPCEEVCVLTLDLEADDGGTLFDVLVALRHFVGGQRRTAAGAVRDDLEALVEEAAVVDLLERPPFGLDEVVLVRDIRVVHVSPEADDLREVFPHALVLPDGLFTFGDERLEAILFDLLLAVEAELLFDFDLNGEAVGVPAGLAGNEVVLHGAVPRDHVLDDTGQDVTDVRFTVRGGRAVIEDVGRTAVLLFGFLKDVRVVPELRDFVFTLHKIEVRGHFLIKSHCVLLLSAIHCCWPVHQ